MSRVSLRFAWLAPALVVGLAIAATGCDRAPIRQPDAGSGAIGGAGSGAGGGAGIGDAGGNAAMGVDAGRDRPPGNPTQPNGASCAEAGECLSGFCADGVCCSTACTEGCRTCAATGSAGICVNRAWGSLPASATSCPVTPVTTCGLDGTCDGLGACRFHQSETVCVPGTCSSDTVVGAQVCDGAGACKPGATVICAPYGCDTSTATCRSGCTLDTHCIAPRVCTNGSCGGGLELGRACTRNGQCRSGFCADGVCCSAPCAGACRSCSLPSALGQCVAIAAGSSDPHGVCADQGAASCGTNGKCDGSGGCFSYPAGTLCAAEGCSGNNKWNSSTCDGAGKCVAAGEPSNCAPYRCDSQAKKCLLGCANNGDCVSSDYYCDSLGVCLPKKVPGVGACTSSAECATGFCVDGVCCATDCTDACMTCARPEAPGKCLPVRAGLAAPRGQCRPEPPCGNDGTCDGNGACRVAPANVVCSSSVCERGVVTTAATCDGLGACHVGVTYSCFPYFCGPSSTSCSASCSRPQDCAPPYTCLNGSCLRGPSGTTCTSDDECNSGHCAQGVCCATACAGQCSSCALPGTLGSCQPLPSPDPALCP